MWCWRRLLDVSFREHGNAVLEEVWEKRVHGEVAGHVKRMAPKCLEGKFKRNVTVEPPRNSAWLDNIRERSGLSHIKFKNCHRIVPNEGQKLKEKIKLILKKPEPRAKATLSLIGKSSRFFRRVSCKRIESIFTKEHCL